MEKSRQTYPEFQRSSKKNKCPIYTKREIYLLVKGGCLEAKVALKQSHERDVALSSVYFICSQFLSTSGSLQISRNAILRITLGAQAKAMEIIFMWIGSQHAEH